MTFVEKKIVEVSNVDWLVEKLRRLADNDDINIEDVDSALIYTSKLPNVDFVNVTEGELVIRLIDVYKSEKHVFKTMRKIDEIEDDLKEINGFAMSTWAEAGWIGASKAMIDLASKVEAEADRKAASKRLEKALEPTVLRHLISLSGIAQKVSDVTEFAWGPDYD